jgi:hypothetical protein
MNLEPQKLLEKPFVHFLELSKVIQLTLPRTGLDGGLPGGVFKEVWDFFSNAAS